MTTAYQAIVALAQLLGNLIEGVTTGAGSTTTTVDTGRTEVNDFWIGGTVFKPATSQSRAISDFVQSSGTITHAAFPLAVGNAAAYMVFGLDFPRWQLFQAVSRALSEMELPAYDVSLTTVARQREYELPASVSDVLQLDIATALAEPYDYQAYYSGWQVVGSKLVWDIGKEPRTSGYTIRLGYLAGVAAVDDDAETIDSRVPLERLKWQAAVHAWRWRIQRGRGQEPAHVQLLNEAIQTAGRMKIKHPLPRMDRYPRLPL